MNKQGVKNSTPKHKAQAAVNGHFGGRPTNAMIELRKRARDRATRIVAANQEEAVRFLVWVMNDPNADLPDRIRCAVELLNRGEMPAKSAAYVGVGSMDDMESMFGTPKLVVFGRFNVNGSSAEVVDGPADGPDVATGAASEGP